jgi:ferredoxin
MIPPLIIWLVCKKKQLCVMISATLKSVMPAEYCVDMADATSKVPENVPGRFYVDSTCIDCDLCREKAPLNFRRDDAARYSYVFQQPTDEEQVAACIAASEECPVEAIGDGGG